MFTSCGYHTFTIAQSLTQEQADMLLKAFKKYRDDKNEICIIECPQYSKDPNGRHYEVVYPKQYKGISWRIRFSDIGFLIDGEYRPCSIKATINPKVLIGEKSYIQAANAAFMSDIVSHFDYEAEKIAPLIRGFYHYSFNRIDYCINFDVSELRFDCPPELRKELPKLIMKLIKHGDIPDGYREEYGVENQFYLKGEAAVINIYWKYAQLEQKFADCRDLGASYDIIRFEVQCKYPKVYQMQKRIKKEVREQKAVLEDELRKSGYYDIEFDLGPDYNSDTVCENKNGYVNKQTIVDVDRLSDIRSIAFRLDKIDIMEMIISDKRCDNEIEKYFNRVIKKGDYYTFAAARNIIIKKTTKWEKAARLINALEQVRSYGGISKVKKMLQEKELENFRRSLRELAELNINPVTIPEEWGIKRIPNLLANYRVLCQEEQAKEMIDEMSDEVIHVNKKPKKPHGK